VVGYHVAPLMSDSAPRGAIDSLIYRVLTAALNGRGAVVAFFVISGFVIMQSMRNAQITPGFIGRFAVRRSLRLDPPYWVTIAAMIVLSMVSGRLQKDHAALPLPTPGAVRPASARRTRRAGAADRPDPRTDRRIHFLPCHQW